MKKYLFLVLAGAMLASCSSNEFDGGQNVLETGNGEISFSINYPNITRGTKDDATKLENKFIVYGWKATKQVVFDNYSVHYEDGSAKQSLSNTSGWEYVGYMNEPVDPSEEAVQQSIKYWDYSASQYDFVAYRILGTSSSIIESLDTAYNETGYNKVAMKFQVPSNDDAGKIYISNQKTVAKANYQKEVDLTFRNLAAKVRLGIYETVPGYSIKDVKFYTTANGTAAAAPALFVPAVSKTAIPSSGNIFVKYQSSDNVALALTTCTDSMYYFTNGTEMNYQAAPEQKESGKFIGRTSNTATYPSTSNDNGYTFAFPHDTLTLNLKVDYTLVALDGKGETIKVTGASAVVPAAYNAWKANHAYTYLFKISDNTNGTTGTPGDPGDPTKPGDPKGLYPITFDAMVISADDESSSQETVTTVATPTFTTYQNGINVTANNEYKAGIIDLSIYDQSVVSGTVVGDVTLTKDNFKLYTVANTGKTTLTEANVANFKNNDLVLTDVSNSITGYASLSTKKLSFKAAAGQIYAAEYKNDAGVYYYKVIKVTGSAAAPVFRFEAYESAICAPTTETDTVMESAKIYVKVKQMIGSKEYCVAGAEKNFDATTTQYFDVTAYNDTVYKLTSKAGIENDVNVPLGIKNVTTASTGSATIRIINYHFTLNGGNVKAGSTNNDILWLYRSDKLHKIDLATQFKVYKDDVDVTSQNMLKITGNSTADGKYDIEVADDAAGKYVVNYYNGTATCEITVDTFTITPAFSANVKALNIGGIDAEKSATLTLKCGGALAKSYAVTNAAPTVAKLAGEDGSTHKASTDATNATIKLTATAAGKAKVTAPGESIEIPVYNFAVTVSGNTVTFKENGTAKNVTLVPSVGTLTKNANTGEYNWTAASTAGATIKYKYNTSLFTLYVVPTP